MAVPPGQTPPNTSQPVATAAPTGRRPCIPTQRFCSCPFMGVNTPCSCARRTYSPTNNASTAPFSPPRPRTFVATASYGVIQRLASYNSSRVHLRGNHNGYRINSCIVRAHRNTSAAHPLTFVAPALPILPPTRETTPVTLRRKRHLQILEECPHHTRRQCRLLTLLPWSKVGVRLAQHFASLSLKRGHHAVNLGNTGP